MSNTNHVINLQLGSVDLSKDDRELLSTMLQALTYITVKLDNIEAALPTVGTPFDAVRAPVVVEPEQVETDTTQEEKPQAVEAAPVAEAVEPEAPKYTKDDIQAMVRKLAAPTSTEPEKAEREKAKREKAKAIVQSYAPKVSDIPEDKYAEVMEKLTALDAEG